MAGHPALPVIVLALLAASCGTAGRVAPESAASADTVTEWLTQPVLKATFDREVANGFYTPRIEGRDTADGPRYRATFRRMPAPFPRFAFYAYVNMDEATFQTKDRDLGAQGFELMWHQQFVGRDGPRHQATWIRDSHRPPTASPVGPPRPGGADAVTDWLTQPVLKATFDREVANGFYTPRIEGRETADGPRYQATFRPSPAPYPAFAFYAYVNMDDAAFQAKDRDLGAQGFRMVWHQQFAGRDGARHQATWVRDRDRPPAGPPRSSGADDGASLVRDAQADLRDNRYADALPKVLRALAIQEQRLGPSHVEVADTLYLLGEVYIAQGRFVDAERVHRRGLAIREERLGRDHAAVAASLNSLAMIHNAQATYADAERLLTRAVQIMEVTPAKVRRDHWLHAEIQENLAKIYRALGRLAEAEEAQAKAAMLWTLQ